MKRMSYEQWLKNHGSVDFQKELPYIMEIGKSVPRAHGQPTIDLTPLPGPIEVEVGRTYHGTFCTPKHSERQDLAVREGVFKAIRNSRGEVVLCSPSVHPKGGFAPAAFSKLSLTG